MPAAAPSATTSARSPAPAALPELEQPRLLARLRPRLVAHFPAVVFILTTLLLPVGAINGQNNLLFWMFGLAIATLVISGITGTWVISSLSIERDPVEPAHAGEMVRITYRIHNNSRWVPAFAINVEELSTLPAAIGPGHVRPTWPGMLSSPTAFAEYIPRGGTVTIEAQVAATSWGSATLDVLEVWTSFPFGLSRKTMLHGRTQHLLVRPPVIRDLLPSFIDRLLNARAAATRGSATTRSGPGDEFHSLRELSDGDSPRSVAWKRSATRDRLLVRQNAREESRRLFIGLADLRGVEPAAARSAIVAAASAVWAGHQSGFSVGLLASAQHPQVAPGSGQRALGEIFDRLAVLDLSAEHTPHAPTGVDARTSVILIDPLRRPAGMPSASVFTPDEILQHATSLVFDPPVQVPMTLAERLSRFLSELLPASRPTLPGGAA